MGFYQVWLKVRELGKWEQADWTVKVDADAVFITQRLRSYLSQIKGDSPHGLYLENCNNVEYGFFGHLEVISRTGTQVLTKYLENCHEEFAPCADEGCIGSTVLGVRTSLPSGVWTTTMWTRWK